MAKKWIASAEYSDGTSIDMEFEYKEEGDPEKERQRQWEIEEWLLSEHECCTWLAVNYIED